MGVIDFVTKELVTMMNNKIPVFYACDKGFVKIMAVSVNSLISNLGRSDRVEIHVLHTDIPEEDQKMVKRMETRNCKIFFDDVSSRLEKVRKKLLIRDYYSCTTYYRLFIADMFPQYDKVIYIDSDTVVARNIADMYRYKLGDNYAGVVHEQLVMREKVFGDYVENVMGISRGAYFNAGVMLINSKIFRQKNMLKKFIDMLNTYSFVVAQDQDYLNVLCKGHLLYLAPCWNVQMIGEDPCPEEEMGIIHYNLAAKPWHYEDCKHGSFFWKYAKETENYSELKEILSSFSDEDRERDNRSGANLLRLAIEEIENEHNYSNQFLPKTDKTVSRIEIRKKIDELEKAGIFDQDVENDPPAPPLLPQDIEYVKKTMGEKLRTIYAFKVAHWFIDYLEYKKQFVVKDIKGLENIRCLNTGAIITCNHFHPFDSFAIQKVYDLSGQKKRKFYRIIKEGNYTGFPGFFGFLMRNCNTLPLSSNVETMKKFMDAVNKLLKDGNFILIYPEQSLWWNYRKPKPLKKGGFTFAAGNNVPVLPVFVTMSDSDVMDGDGFPVQEYTINIGSPIWPDKNRTKAENVKYMMDANYEVWKKIYEETYKMPLKYTCDENKNE